MKPQDRGLLPVQDVTDDRVEAWLAEAKAGDTDSLANLRRWVYATARQYFDIRARRERFVTDQDAEEMASSLFLEFDNAWPRIRSATKYTRYLLSNWVARYLKTKRLNRHREQQIEVDVAVVDEANEHPWRSWDDTAWARYRVVLQRFASVDSFTRTVVVGRLTTPPRPYRELATELQTTETALRMRMTRFFKSVRVAYEAASSDERAKLRDLPPLRELPLIEDVIRNEPRNTDSLK
jgi:hypothetical protein